MKRNSFRFLFVWVCACLVTGIGLNANAQNVKMLISIADKQSEPVVTKEKDHVKVHFNKKALDNISAKHSFKKFERAYPNAAESYLRNLWRVETDGAGLLEELQQSDAAAFPYGRIETTPTPLYTPNDYGYVGSWNLQSELDLIHAKAAWDITKGDTSVLIGITDTYFDSTNPDLAGKLARVRSSVNYSGSGYDHGTMVATLAAGNTDNGTGMSSIGYNCRLDVSTEMGSDNVMLAMSEDGVRVLNGSWYNNCYYDFVQQGVYDAVYDNGTVACFAAGNGSCGAVNAYVYPAALDHNIAVTAIGSQFPQNTYNYTYSNTLTGYSWTDVHDKIIGFPATDYNHNDKVDIAAPGYGVSSGYYVANNPGYQFQAYNGWGTSFASPIVAGTVGLIFSANKTLSPYQVEYILKKSAVNVDTIPMNLPYTGQLGAGRLDAGAAVAMAANMNVNDPATAAMFIAGIDISTRCRPGAVTGSAKPVLTPVVVNGVAPYTYRWEAVPGNSAVLSASNVANPQVTAMSNVGNEVWFRLTVTDNSPVKKVATKVIHATLNSNNTYELTVRDSYSDAYNEFNNQDSVDRRDWNLWRSPDVWNRQQADGITADQPANYTLANNYVYVRVHNVGCAASPSPTKSTTPAKLRVFWSFPSTSHKWQNDFANTFTYSNGTSTIAAGGEITATPADIPVIQPGDETVIRIPWQPVNYTVAAPGAKEGNLSLLARITQYSATTVRKTVKLTEQGIGITETANTEANVRSANALSLNNIVKLSVDAGNTVNSAAAYFTNIDQQSQTMNFRINAMKDVYKYMSGDFKKLLTVKIYLGNLYSRWVNGGRLGKYLSYNDAQQTVLFDDISNAALDNISMMGNEHAPVIVEVAAKTPFVNVPAHLQEFMISQLKSGTNERTGVIDFQVRYNTPVNSGSAASTYKTAETNTVAVAEKAARLSVYPNPVTGSTVYAIFTGTAMSKAIVQVTDMTGRVVYTQNYGTLEARQPIAIPVSNLATGMYHVRITGNGQQLDPVKFVVTR